MTQLSARSPSSCDFPPHSSPEEMANAAEQLWTQAKLPQDALRSLVLGQDHPCQSTFRVGELASATIGCAALAAAQIIAYRRGTPYKIPQVAVDPQDALTEFMSERMATLNGQVQFRAVSTLSQTLKHLVFRPSKFGIRLLEYTEPKMAG